ncbi:C4-dicarboxylate ABC transporter permease [Rhodobacterales bacterium 56_14_T64]|nr:C4-dicarboxylate ABC transporter permease [Rhodobacterales bacterium 56_14_T64]
MLYQASKAWARVEIFCAATLAATVSGLILLNVVTRSMGQSIYWVDEAAIYAMVWMTFLAASAAVHHRSAVAVTLLPELASPRVGYLLARFADIIVFVFAALLIWICWRWFMPLELARQGFDIKAFQGATFNFVYAEPTNTLGIKKVWIWLVVPLFAFGSLLHASANLTHPAPAEEDAP